MGRKVLTEEDILESREPEDTVVRCSYPIDIHSPESSATKYREDQDIFYGIPYGCLLPRALDNIAAAGRCIGATHEAAGSFRVMATCMALGEAAGVAAALAAKRGGTLGDVSAQAVRARMDEALARVSG